MANHFNFYGQLTKLPHSIADNKGCELFIENTIYKGQKIGEKRQTIPVTVWGPVAQACFENLDVGSTIFVEGQIETREWKNGNQDIKHIMTLTAKNVHFLDAKKGNQPEHHEAPSEQQQLVDAQSSLEDDDIPF